MNTMLAAPDLPWQELHGDLRAFVARRVRNEADVDVATKLDLRGKGLCADGGLLGQALGPLQPRIHKLLTVEPLRVEPKERDTLIGTGRSFVVVDTVGAGQGEMVLIVQGSSARLTPETEKLPIVEK